MRVGLDSYTVHHLPDLTGIKLLKLARDYGLEGVQFGHVRQISPALDHAEIQEVREFARAHRLYVEVGIPCPNPHLPGPLALRDGDGDLRAGLRRHLEAAALAVVGSRAIRCFIGGPGDRYTRPVPWPQQIADTVAVARDLTPLLRDLGLKLAFETHADATTFELIRVVAELGPDIAGICLDTGNLVITLADPLAAAIRAAPYTIATHVKDGIVTFADDGLVFNPRPCGQGVLPLAEILAVLARSNPDLPLSIEDHGRLFPMPIFRDDYLATFPDLQAVELAHLVHLARDCEQQIVAERLACPAAIEAIPWEEQATDRLTKGACYLRKLVASLDPNT